MEQQLTLLTLGVRDLDVSRRFYVDGLGWAATLVLPSVVFIHVGHGLVLSLYGRDDLHIDAYGHGAAPPADGRPNFTLAHNVDSEAAVDSEMARFVAAGATVVKPAQRADWGGYHGYVSDPDGFLWEIAHNAGLTFDADGRATFGPPA
jgi:catechol 2,3-dioxygenase-like lactoylglutathione lyase family enzyme